MNTPIPDANEARSGTGSRVAQPIRSGLSMVRWCALGAASGVLAGGSGWVFLTVLNRVTTFRLDHPVTVWFLPLGGLVIGLVWHYLGGRAARGNTLLLEQIHDPTDWVPRRMAPLVLVGTWATHLVGGSAGREGTALQMSGSLTDALSRILRLDPDTRRTMLIASLAGGFGAVFGVPVAATVFALEVQTVGRVRYEALLPSLCAAVVGDQVVRSLGYHHELVTARQLDLTPRATVALIALGVACGLLARTFTGLSHAISAVMTRRVSWPPARLVIGGCVLLALTELFGRRYGGLSTPLATAALAGASVGIATCLLKLLFTAVTLGTGFPGGEVTPLFVMGATLGAALAGVLGLPVGVAAALGFVAVFAGAANTPLACVVMGVELFGAGLATPLAIVCVGSYLCSAHHGIYGAQRISVAKR